MAASAGSPSWNPWRSPSCPRAGRKTRSADAYPGHQRVIRAGGAVEDLPGLFRIDVEAGDAVEIETPGGGGYGA